MNDLRELSQKLIETSDLGILAYRAQGACVLANEAAARMIGATVEEARAQDFRRIETWKSSGLLENAERALADGKPRSVEAHFVTTFGREVSLGCTMNCFESHGEMHLLLMMSDVTRDRHTEAELRLRIAALDAAANAIVITDRDGTIQWVNRAFCTLTGYAAEEVAGRNPRLLKSGVHDDEFYRHLHETIQAGSVWRGEIVNRYKDGRLGYEEQTITPVRGDDGTVTHFIAIKVDIGERRAREEVQAFLSQTASKLDGPAFFEAIAARAAQSLGAEVGFVGRVRGPGWVRTLGLYVDGRVVSPVEYDVAGTPCEEVMAKGSAVYLYGIQERFPDDRMLVDLGVSGYAAVAFLAADGTPLGHVGVMSRAPLHDARSLNGLLRLFAMRCGAESERQDEVQRRFETEAKFRTIFEGAMDGIVLVSTDGERFSDPNPRFCEMLGYSTEELCRLGVRDIHPAEDLPEVFGLFNATLSGKRIGGDAVRLRRKDGGVFRAEVNGRPIEVDGETYMLGIFRDLTERDQKELALRAREVAESANLAKSQFLASMSHELRTPLNAIIGYSEMVSEDIESIAAPQTIDDLLKIREAGHHLLDLINDVLDLSRIEAGKLELSLERCSVPSLVESVAEAAVPLMRKNGIDFQVDCDAGLGEVDTDPVKLRQILLNLVSNAAKFTSAGLVRLTARRQHDGTGSEHLVIAVRDTGIGMSGEQIRRLFQPFAQADSSIAREYGGAGLGLAISRRLAEALGGEIDVTSEPGKGSTFTVRLPTRCGAAGAGSEDGGAGDRPQAGSMANRDDESEGV